MPASSSSIRRGHPAEDALVLKKPFFKNWEDFMDFNDTIKHRMPITLCEFDLLLQKEAEDMRGWDMCVDRKDLRVAKTLENNTVVTVCACAVFPNIDVHAAFHLFYNFDERMKWDKTFSNMYRVDTDVNGSDVVYCILKAPTVTTRDFLQYRRVRVLEDGTICIVLRSAEHPSMPEDPRYIRVENKISGYILRQGHEGGQPMLRLFLMTCSDAKGMIPKTLTNFMAPRMAIEWMNSLSKAAKDFQRNQPHRKEELAENVQKLSLTNPFDYEIESQPVPQLDQPERPCSSERRALDTVSEHSGEGSRRRARSPAWQLGAV